MKKILVDKLPQHIKNRSRSEHGGIMQLISQSVSDHGTPGMLCGCEKALPYNSSAYNSSWHLSGDDGYFVQSDIEATDASIFEHYPEEIKPKADDLHSVSISREKAAQNRSDVNRALKACIDQNEIYQPKH